MASTKSTNDFSKVLFLPDAEECNSKAVILTVEMLQRSKLDAPDFPAEASTQPEVDIDIPIVSANALVPDLISDLDESVDEVALPKSKIVVAPTEATADPVDFLTDSFISEFIESTASVASEGAGGEIIEMADKTYAFTDAYIPRRPRICVPESLPVPAESANNEVADGMITEESVSAPSAEEAEESEEAEEAPKYHVDVGRDPETNISDREARYLRLRNAFEHWQRYDYCAPYYEYMYMFVGIVFGITLVFAIGLLVFNSKTCTNTTADFLTRIKELQEESMKLSQIVKMLEGLYPDVYGNVTEAVNATVTHEGAAGQ